MCHYISYPCQHSFSNTFINHITRSTSLFGKFIVYATACSGHEDVQHYMHTYAACSDVSLWPNAIRKGESQSVIFYSVKTTAEYLSMPLRPCMNV